MAPDIVDLTSSPADSPALRDFPEEEEEDADLKLAIALSLQQHEAEHNERQETSAQSTFDVPDVGVTTPTSDASNTNGFRGLDRKAMEAERLARLKRKRDASDEGGQADSARISPPPLRRAMASRSQGKQDSISKANGTSSHSKSNATASNTYPQGKVFKTYAPGYPADDTISFSDLLSPLENLKSALLSSFIWDFDWLLPNFSTYLNSINLLLVMHAKQPFHKQQLEADFQRIKTVKLCFPPMDGSVHCMHSKLILLFYEAEETNDEKWRERCRIVVPTGNLVPFDWGAGSVMENMLWVLDLPLLTPTEDAQRQQSTEFKRSLVGFLRAQTVPDAVLTRLDRFDFVETQDMRFVHTIGGAHSGETWRDTGLCGLGEAVSSLGLATGDAIDVDFVTSSVGSLNDEFMRSMYLACQGDDGLAEYTLRNAKTLPAKRIGASTDKQLVHKNSGSGWKDHFRLYFPSQKTVASSNGGPRSAGTICFSEKWWEGAKFPRGNMRDCLSVRDGMLMHNKVRVAAIPLLVMQTLTGAFICTDAQSRSYSLDCPRQSLMALPKRGWTQTRRRNMLAGYIWAVPIFLRVPGESAVQFWLQEHERLLTRSMQGPPGAGQDQQET